MVNNNLSFKLKKIRGIIMDKKIKLFKKYYKNI